MDSITHLFYGGAIAAAIAPARHRRAALLAGAALNTLPDLDIFPLALSDNPVLRMTWHRSATHSWLVLPLVAWAVWAFCLRRGGRVAEAPRRWWWAIFICLMAHPLLDAFTVYGTQLFWPLPKRPVMWSSLFIVDPWFTLPWFVACVVAWFARDRIAGSRALALGIALGAGYVGWSLAAKALVARAAAPVLASMDLGGAPRFSVPAPMTTLSWRVVAMAPGGFFEGARRIGDPAPMTFAFHRSDTAALQAASGVPAVRRLTWFNHGFQKADVRDGTLVLSDVRMGQAPDYSFSYAVARRAGDGWQALSPPYDVERHQLRKALAMFAKRLLRGDRVKVEMKPGVDVAAGAAAPAPAGPQAAAGSASDAAASGRPSDKASK